MSTNNILANTTPTTTPVSRKCATKQKRGTKQCGDCFNYAGNNKQKNCRHCAKNGQVVSNWLKATKKIQGIGRCGRGKVCKHCDWSTKGNRTLICGGCHHPFPTTMKRKAEQVSKKNMQVSKKKKRKKSKNPPIIPFIPLEEFDSIDLGNLGFTPLSSDILLEMDAEQGSVFLREDFLEMYSNVELPDEDFIRTDEDCVKFFGTKNIYKEGITI